jgi:tellurite methyltransferase
MNNHWKIYSERTKERPPRELLTKAIGYVQHRGQAIDLGPGALNDANYLLEQGFQMVVAVNKDPLQADPVAHARAAEFPKDRFAYRVSTFDAFDFKPDTYDLINAQYALPFNPPETFDRMFASLIASLKSGGIVTGQFFGPNDEWSSNANLTFVTRERAQQLLQNCEIISLQEVEGTDRLAVGGQKYWHTFHFIARKK